MKTQNKTATTKAIWGVVKRGEQQKGISTPDGLAPAGDPGAEKRGGRSFWTRIGTAYVNRDGSLNLRFDYLPANLGETTIQVRTLDSEKGNAGKADAGDKAEPELANTPADELLA